MSSTLTSKGQVTVPKRLRDHLGLKPGAEVEFVLGPNGEVVVRPSRRPSPKRRKSSPFSKLRGTLKTGMSTDDLMRLLRGYDQDSKDPGFQ